jgi:hypothetical protein
MSTASDLLVQHFETLVADNARWQTLIADEIVWELPYAPAIGHPARLSGREAVVRHATWFLAAVEPGVCRVPPGRSREDHSSSRVLRSGACGQGAGRADRRSITHNRTLMLEGATPIALPNLRGDASDRKASASASVRRPAPRARAMADEIPPPMAPPDIDVDAIEGDGRSMTEPGRRFVQNVRDVRLIVNDQDADLVVRGSGAGAATGSRPTRPGRPA